MIKNDRQYRIAKSQAERLGGTLKILEDRRDRVITSDPILDAQVTAIRGERDLLLDEVKAYEALASGQRPFLELRELSDLPRILIEARIASGMSQSELAAQLGMKEQQIQRYEATDYAGTSIARLGEIATVLGIHLPSTLRIATLPRLWHHLASQLEDAGFDRNLIRKRLLPTRELGVSEPGDAGSPSWEGLVAPIARILGVQVDTFAGSSPLRVDPIPLATARFKLASRHSQPRIATYALYAHHLATTLVAASENQPKTLPDEWSAMRREIADVNGSISLQDVLSYLWERGTVVLPLSDPGRFHAAFWRIDGRNAIVLKQKTRSEARWLFDLLHECYHAAKEPALPSRSVIDGGDPLSAYRDDPEEREASTFAGQVLLSGRAEDLARLCVAQAGGSVERLKAAVQAVSRQEKVSPGILANYMAYRLSLQEVNWWGAASSLQERTDDPWRTTRDFLLVHINTRLLERGERDLLERALRE